LNRGGAKWGFRAALNLECWRMMKSCDWREKKKDRTGPQTGYEAMNTPISKMKRERGGKVRITS